VIVSLYAGLLALFYIALSLNVVRGRRQYRISLGDGGNEAMGKRIRAHANFSEYTPLFLILLALAEYQGLPAYAVHAFGASFLIARVLHAYSIIYAAPSLKLLRPRPLGMILTFVSLAGLALVALVQFL
jgi:uncharacterized membrane protein YecN with MAPEG domain